jgi:hypothetical protein
MAWTARLLVSFVGLALAVPALSVAQQGSITGVVAAKRQDPKSGEDLLLEVESEGDVLIDRLVLKLPKGRYPSVDLVVQPDGWTAQLDGRELQLSGPQVPADRAILRLDMAGSPIPNEIEVKVFSGQDALFHQKGIGVVDLGAPVVSTEFCDNLVVPDVITPGEIIKLGLVDPALFHPAGSWQLSLQLAPGLPAMPLDIVQMVASQTQAASKPVSDTLLNTPQIQAPTDSAIVNALLEGVRGSGFARGDPAAWTGTSDDISDVRWGAALDLEKETQRQILEDFTKLTRDISNAVASYDAASTSFREAFLRVQSGSMGLQALVASWPEARAGAQKADLAAAVASLAYGGVRLGLGIYKWLRSRKVAQEMAEAGTRAAAGGSDDVAEAGARTSVSGVDEATGTATGGQLAASADEGARGLGYFKDFFDPLMALRRSNLEDLARQAGVDDLPAFIAQHGGDTQAEVALVRRIANARGLTELQPQARNLLSRLVVAARNARAGRPGMVSPSEIATLREWSRIPDFWPRLRRAASWYEEPGWIGFGEIGDAGEDVFHFALDFSPDEISLLRALATSDDLAQASASVKLTEMAARRGVVFRVPDVVNRPPSTAPPSTAALDTPTVRGDLLPSTGSFTSSPAGESVLLRSASKPGHQTVRLSPEEILNATHDWATWTPERFRAAMQALRGADTVAPSIAPAATNIIGVTADSFRYVGAIETVMQATFDDQYGYPVVHAERPLYLVPGFVPENPKISGCTPMGFPGQTFCVCGAFPGDSANSLYLDGEILGPPVSSSGMVSYFTVPQNTSAGPHQVTGDPAAGYGPSDRAQVTALVVGGSIDQNKLWSGQSTTLRLWVEGTTESLKLRLRNHTPSVVAVEGGEDQVVSTSGGKPNDLSRTVSAGTPGNFNITYSLDAPPCPCAEGLYQALPPIDFEAGARTIFDLLLEPPAGLGPPGSTPLDQIPVSFDDWTASEGIMGDLWLLAHGDNLVEAYPQLVDTIAERRGWHTIPADVEQVIHRLLVEGRLAVAGFETSIPAGDLAQLSTWSQVEGFWTWLATTRADTSLSAMLRYSSGDIGFLQALVASQGDIAQLKTALGPVRTVALESTISAGVGQQPGQTTVDAQAKVQHLIDGARAIEGTHLVAGFDNRSIFNIFWGENDVFAAARYYGWVDGQDPGMSSLGWAVLGELYSLISAPTETFFRHMYVHEAFAEYEEYLSRHGGDLQQLSTSLNDAIGSLRQIQYALRIAGLDSASTALGGRGAGELQSILQKYQQTYNQASPNWQQAHASELAARTAHIKQKLADLATSLGALKDLEQRIPHMIEWLDVLQQAPDGSAALLTDLFNPEGYIRMSSIGLFLDNLGDAGAALKGDLTAERRLRGLVNQDGKPMSFDELMQRVTPPGGP